jgi:hypothetical protein
VLQIPNPCPDPLLQTLCAATPRQQLDPYSGMIPLTCNERGTTQLIPLVNLGQPLDADQSLTPAQFPLGLNSWGASGPDTLPNLCAGSVAIPEATQEEYGQFDHFVYRYQETSLTYTLSCQMIRGHILRFKHPGTT